MEELAAMLGILFVLVIILAPLVLLVRTVSRTSALERELTKQGGEIKALQNIVQNLLQSARGVEVPPQPQTTTEAPSITQPSVAVPKPVVIAEYEPSITPPRQAEQSKPTEALPPKPIPQPPSLEKERPRRTNVEWEAFVGGNVLNRIGAIALILGTGFFLQYAFDANLIPVWLRPLIGVCIALILLLTAHRLHGRTFEVLTQGLIGAGISVLYLSVFAAYNFYNLLPMVVAFGCMISVTTLGFILALRANSLAIALLAWAGGFLTPFLLPTGEVNAVGLFSYIAFLDVGLLALILMKDIWIILKPLTFGATWFIAWLWYGNYYASGNYFSTAVFFIVVYWLLFFVVDFSRAYMGYSNRDDIWHRFEAMLNSGVAYTSLFTIVNPFYHSWMATITVIYGFVYFASGLLIQRRHNLFPPSDNTAAFWHGDFARLRYLLTAYFYLMTGIGVQFEGVYTAVFWGVQALCMLWWYSNRQNEPILRYAALTVLAAGIGKLLFTPELYSARGYTLLWNNRLLGYGVLTVLCILSARIFTTVNELSKKQIVALLYSIAGILLFIWCSLETHLYFESQIIAGGDFDLMTYRKVLTCTIVWAILGWILLMFGRIMQATTLLYGGMIVSLIGVALVFMTAFVYTPIKFYTPVLNIRVSAVLTVIIICIIFRRELLGMVENSLNGQKLLSQIYGGAVFLLLFALLTGETSDLLRHQMTPLYELEWTEYISKQVRHLQNMQQLSLSLVWLGYSIVVLILGINRRNRGARLGAIGLFGVSILKIFLYDLSFLETLYRIFSFIVLGVLLLVVSYLYQRYKHRILGETETSATEVQPQSSNGS